MSLPRIVSDKFSAGSANNSAVVNQPRRGQRKALASWDRCAASRRTDTPCSSSALGFVVSPSLFAEVPYDPVRDFAPISIVAVSPNVVSVHPSVPARDHAGADPRSSRRTRASTASRRQVSAARRICRGEEIFRLSNDLGLPTVQFAGAAPAINQPLAATRRWPSRRCRPRAPQIQQGFAARPVAVTAEKRSKALPDVPEAIAPGGHLSGQEAYTLTGMLAHRRARRKPSSTSCCCPGDHVTLVALPDVRARLDELGFPSRGQYAQEFAQRIKIEMEKWAQVIRDAKIKPQETK